MDGCGAVSVRAHCIGRGVVSLLLVALWRQLGMREGVPLLLLVSMCTTSYSWFFDQIVLLPCIFHGMAWVIRGSRKKIFFSSAAFLIINGAALTLILMHRTSFWYAWTAPAWLFWYLAAGTTAFPRNQGLE